MLLIVYYIIVASLILLIIGRLAYILHEQRVIIHFQILNKESKLPVSGLDIYRGITLSSSTRGYTLSGEPVIIPGSNASYKIKKIGKTNKRGTFKRTYYFQKDHPFYFKNLSDPENIRHFCFGIDILRLNHKNDKPKIFYMDNHGKIHLTNPNKKDKDRNLSY